MKYSFLDQSVVRIPIKPLKIEFSKEDIKSLFSKNEVKEALFLSSPVLFNECLKWLNTTIQNNPEEDNLVNSLLKYALRMHSRCTPFGLFAGCGVLTFPYEEKFIINNETLQRSTRLDMNYTCALALALSKKPYIKPYLRFFPNTSIYFLYDKIRYIEYSFKDKRRIHQISAVDNSEYLQVILDVAKYGATIDQLIHSLISDEITYSEASTFVNDIIESQILISELEPSITGSELLEQILVVLTAINYTSTSDKLSEVVKILKNIQKCISNIDENIGNELFVYKEIIEILEFFEIPFEENKLFQTDLFLYPVLNNCSKSNPVELSDSFSLSNYYTGSTQEQLFDALAVINKLNSYHENPNLKAFKEKFSKRYEDKEIPLSDALDNETGIGYGINNNQSGDINPLVENLIVPRSNNDNINISYDRKQSFLFKKLLDAYQKSLYIVEITDESVKEFDAVWNDLPESFALMYRHLGTKDGKDVICFENAGGSSAINLLGRFGVGNKEVDGLIKRIAQHEQRQHSTKLVAAILHLPESRTGNVLLHPTIRDYEIPYLSQPSLSFEQQIPLDDILVSIRQNRIVLWSKQFNKEIIPRLDNAHNYSFNAVPAYHFLCDLQTQNLRSGLSFDWGVLKDEFFFLPRVVYKNVILAPATWQLRKEQFQALLNCSDLTLEVKKWQEQWRMPKLILLVDGDNELLINLNDELCQKMFVSEIKNRNGIKLKEFLFDENSTLVRDELGNGYTNEFIAILVKEKMATSLVTEIHSGEICVDKSTSPTIQRAFSIGSEWLYYKIYCGVKTADRLLTEIIKPITERLIEENLIDSWFFIRYADPDIHLRLRFHFTSTEYVGTVIERFREAVSDFQEYGLIWNIQTDTYQRELERYGINGIVFSEKLFHYDSVCTINFLDMIEGREGEEYRWLFGLKAVDELLTCFAYTLEQKLSLVEGLKIDFAREFNMNQNLKTQLDKRYREKRMHVDRLLMNDVELNDELQLVCNVLNKRSLDMMPVVYGILDLQHCNALGVSLNSLMASFIHMQLNRLFKNKQRLHEMIIYDYLWRTYRSSIARQRHT